MQLLFLAVILTVILLCILIPVRKIILRFNPQAERASLVPLIWIAVIYIFVCAIAACLVSRQTLGYIPYAIFMVCGLAGIDIAVMDLMRSRTNHAGIILFTAYLMVLFFITIFGRGALEHGEGINMYFFESLLPKSRYSHPEPYHFLQNIALFLPAGAFLCLSEEKKRRSVFKAFYIGCAITVLIETTQGIFHLGLCDIDDMTANILGCMIGYGLTEVFCAIAKRQKNVRERK